MPSLLSAKRANWSSLRHPVPMPRQTLRQKSERSSGAVSPRYCIRAGCTGSRNSAAPGREDRRHETPSAGSRKPGLPSLTSGAKDKRNVASPRRRWSRCGRGSSAMWRSPVAGSKPAATSLKLLRCVMELEDLLGRELRMEAFTVDMTAAEMMRRSRRDLYPIGRRKMRIAPLLSSCCPGPWAMVQVWPRSARSWARWLTSSRYVIRIWLRCSRDKAQSMSWPNSAMDQINAAHPRGDIRLLAYSLGGGVAFEVVTRLIAAGRSVNFSAFWTQYRTTQAPLSRDTVAHAAANSIAPYHRAPAALPRCCEMRCSFALGGEVLPISRCRRSGTSSQPLASC